MFEIANNKNFIKKRQEIRSIQSIRKITLLRLLYLPETLLKLVKHSVCFYQDASPGTLFWVHFLDEPEHFHLFRALHEIYAMICNRLEHGLRQETNRIEMTETQISFELADCF